MGWKKLEFDLAPLVSIFLRVAGDIQYATTETVDDDLSILNPFVLDARVQRVRVLSNDL